MKLRFKTVVCSVLALAAAGSVMYNVSAASSTAGTDSDPLVTKSYVDTAMANVMNAFSNQTQTGTNTSSDGFEPVFVEKGQTIIGKGGSEIILRSGTAAAYTESQDGIIDVTTGLEYHNGENIDANHMLIVSRDDGRGAAVSSEGGAWFIIKGGYTVK